MIGGREKCAICSQMTNLFSYGVTSCNACTLFFRRVISGKHPVSECKNQQLCRFFSLRCRFCRFQKCLEAGMSHTPVESPIPEKPANFRKEIHHLEQLESLRTDRLTNYWVPENVDYTIDELAQGVVRLIGKPETPSQSFIIDWGFMCGFATIDMMRKLKFVDLLEAEDVKTYVRNSHFQCGVFSNAWRSYSQKFDTMVLPDGSEPLPVISPEIFTPDFLNRIRVLLVGRIVELKVTREEYLLLTAVLMCNTVTDSHFSESARALISSHQRMYTSALLQYCFVKYQAAGPSRITDLFSLFTVINATSENMRHHFQLLKLHEPKLQRGTLFRTKSRGYYRKTNQFSQTNSARFVKIHSEHLEYLKVQRMMETWLEVLIAAVISFNVLLVVCAQGKSNKTPGPRGRSARKELVGAPPVAPPPPPPIEKKGPPKATTKSSSGDAKPGSQKQAKLDDAKSGEKKKNEQQDEGGGKEGEDADGKGKSKGKGVGSKKTANGPDKGKEWSDPNSCALKDIEPLPFEIKMEDVEFDDTCPAENRHSMACIMAETREDVGANKSLLTRSPKEVPKVDPTKDQTKERKTILNPKQVKFHGVLDEPLLSEASRMRKEQEIEKEYGHLKVGNNNSSKTIGIVDDGTPKKANPSVMFNNHNSKIFETKEVMTEDDDERNDENEQ